MNKIISLGRFPIFFALFSSSLRERVKPPLKTKMFFGCKALRECMSAIFQLCYCAKWKDWGVGDGGGWVLPTRPLPWILHCQVIKICMFILGVDLNLLFCSHVASFNKAPQQCLWKRWLSFKRRRKRLNIWWRRCSS